MAIKPIELLIRARDEASSVLGSVQGKLTAIGAAVATYFGINAFFGAVKGAAEFEAAMSRVEAATGASADELKLLHKAAEDAGAASKYTSTQAANALETLAKAGLDAKSAIAALPAVLNLAQAGDIELSRASEFLTKAVMGMGLAFTESGRVADVLALGANATNTSVSGLAEALSYAAPVAHSLGLSLESTVAIIGKFADAGIDASRAGTALNAILSQFSDPASKFRQELGTAGIITRNFETALHELAKAGPAGQKAILAVGLEAGPALRALLGQGMGALDGLTEKLKGAEGSAAATAKVMQNNLLGSFTSLSSTWDTVKNVLGTPVLPVLKDAVQQLDEAFKSAVADGTVQKFGDAIAVGFQSGIKWARDFLAQIDFTEISAYLRAFADRLGEVFTNIGEYASTAGNSARLAYGVMSTGANTVLAVVYMVGEAFAGVASNIQSGLALLLEGLSKITFGGISASFKAAAEEVKVSAGATWAASEEFSKNAEDAFASATKSAEIASAGWDGLTASTDAAGKQASASEGAFKQVADTLQKVGTEATTTGQKATEGADKQKLAADTARAAVAQLKTEYEAALAAGNVQLALEKMQAMQTALKSTASQAKLTAEDIAAAFQRMGITSTADLKLQAVAAKRDYDIIKGAATSTAADISNAFKKAADDAIKANNGIAPSWVTAQASARGYEVQVDSAGKATLRAAGEAVNSVDALASAYTRAGQAAQNAADSAVSALERQNAEVERLNAALEKSADLERKRLNIDKEGFSTGSDGQRIVAGTDLGTLTGIAAFLKSAGVDDDKVARKLALEFSDGKGNIDYIGNAGQKKYGGDTLSMAVLKAAETYTFSSANNAPAPAASATPATTPAAAAPAATTYVTNITIPGSAQKTISMTDAASSANLTDILNQLAAARGTAS
jgi:TP901 family phage tail tape measure protein